MNEAAIGATKNGRFSCEGGIVVERQHRALAGRGVRAGDVVFRLDGVVVDRPDRYSVQVGVDRHLTLPPDRNAAETDRFPWRFLNHSCAPNATIRGRELVALRDIHALEEVTFDYETTEWELASPFPCACGAERCRGEVRGYRFLDREARARLSPYVAPHLLRR